MDSFPKKLNSSYQQSQSVLKNLSPVNLLKWNLNIEISFLLVWKMCSDNCWSLLIEFLPHLTTKIQNITKKICNNRNYCFAFYENTTTRLACIEMCILICCFPKIIIFQETKKFICEISGNQSDSEMRTSFEVILLMLSQPKEYLYKLCFLRHTY